METNLYMKNILDTVWEIIVIIGAGILSILVAAFTLGAYLIVVMLYLSFIFAVMFALFYVIRLLF